jgi:hypothetical protein
MRKTPTSISCILRQVSWSCAAWKSDISNAATCRLPVQPRDVPRMLYTSPSMLYHAALPSPLYHRRSSGHQPLLLRFAVGYKAPIAKLHGGLRQSLRRYDALHVLHKSRLSATRSLIGTILGTTNTYAWTFSIPGILVESTRPHDTSKPSSAMPTYLGILARAEVYRASYRPWPSNTYQSEYAMKEYVCDHPIALFVYRGRPCRTTSNMPTLRFVPSDVETAQLNVKNKHMRRCFSSVAPFWGGSSRCVKVLTDSSARTTL